MGKHIDKLYQHDISRYQELSEEFIYKHSGKIIFKLLLRNDKLGTYSKECQQFILSNILEDIQPHRIRKSELTRYMRKEYNKYEVLCQF